MNLIVVECNTSIFFVARWGSDRMFRFYIKRNTIVEVDSPLDASAMALEIINYKVSVTLPGMYWVLKGQTVRPEGGQ